MSIKRHSSIPPEIELADIFLRSFPRVNKVTAVDLADYINQEYPAERVLYLDSHAAAMEMLIAGGYVMKYPADALSGGMPRYGLTQEGRDLKSEGSFSGVYLESKENKVFTKRVGKADGHKKIWDNRSKYFVFLFGAVGAAIVILGFWANHKAASGPDKSPAQAVPSISAADSATRQTQAKKDPASFSARKRHTKTEVAEKPAVSGSPGDGASRDRNAVPNTEQKTQPLGNVPPPRPAEPVQSTVSDNTEFKLLKAQGNTRTQSITMTVVLTTSAANWIISSGVKSIIDNDGNEYNLKAYTLGANTIFTQVELITGVPIKCTYTFGGVLPDVKRIKLFNFIYYHSGGPFHIEFRDIPIDWR